jgi:hypothetical protein
VSALVTVDYQRLIPLMPSSLLQTQVLYDAEGIFNPHAARAAKKQKKKAEKLGDDDGSDYDFDTDYTAAKSNGHATGAEVEGSDEEVASGEEEASEGEEGSEEEDEMAE